MCSMFATVTQANCSTSLFFFEHLLMNVICDIIAVIIIMTYCSSAVKDRCSFQCSALAHSGVTGRLEIVLPMSYSITAILIDSFIMTRRLGSGVSDIDISVSISVVVIILIVN